MPDFIETLFRDGVMSLVFIVMVGVHVLEEALKGFRRFFNVDWFETGDEGFPVSRLEALLKDQIGLFAALAALAIAGVGLKPAMLVAVGFITADLIQHVVFSIVRRGYTPGIATSALYLIFVVYFARVVLEFQFGLRTLGFMALGAGGLLLNYFIASWRVRKRQQKPQQKPQKAEPAAV